MGWRFGCKVSCRGNGVGGERVNGRCVARPTHTLFRMRPPAVSSPFSSSFSFSFCPSLAVSLSLSLSLSRALSLCVCTAICACVEGARSPSCGAAARLV